MERVILRFSILASWRRTFRLFTGMLLVLMSTAFDSYAQTVVKGKITDESGISLPGVNILLKGTTIGTTSDSNGAYSIDVPGSDAVLVYSFIGYESKEVAVGTQTVIDISLVPSVESLAEVVVVGYGVQKKSDVTGAMSSITGEALKEVPVATVTQALQGRVAGLEINSTTSRPGGGAQIRIRGSRSLTASNDPLIVLNGIPFTGTIDDINPSDIASIDVLKDASATAIYGSRGSNGVILITTKRGKEGKTQVYYDGYYGVSSAIGKYDVMSGAEFDALRKEATAAGASYQPTPAEVANLAAGKEVDWQDEAYESGYITNHQVGAQGGTNSTQFNLSAGYFKQTTVLPGQAFTRYSVQGGIDQKVGNRVRVGLNTMNQFNVRDGEGVSMMFSLLTLSPLYDAYNPDGSINMYPALNSPNPETISPLLVRDQNNWKQQRRRLRTFNTLYGEIDIAKGLKYRLNIGLDLWQDNYGSYEGSLTPFRNGSANGADVQNTNAWSYTLENIVTYEKTFGGKHKVLFTGLYSVQELEEYRSASTANSLPADYMYYYNLGLGVSSVPLNNNYYSRWGLVSWMGRLNYSFDDRFLATVTVRADGSSRLAEGNKWFTYPAVALAWNIHNESFLSSVGAITNLKLRAGIGTVSNQAVNPYASLGGLSGFDGRTAEPYNFGSSGTFGYLVTASPNPYLNWEFTTTTNIGLDFGLFNNRVTGSFELYQQDTKDVLQSVALPPTSGVGSVTKNVGETRNRGIELTLSTINIKRPSGFTWGTDFNFFVNRSEITYLANGVKEDIGRAWFIGQPIDVIFDYEKTGIVQQDETALPGFIPGNIRIKDQDGNNVINASDRVILGTLQPDWSGGLTSRMGYKGFDFNFVLFWRVGGLLNSNFYGTHGSNPLNSLEGRRSGPDVDYWTPTNPTNAYPRPGQGQGPNYGTTLGYFDATYMKVRSIQLGYSLPAPTMEKLGLSSLYVYAQVQNPFKAFFSDYVKEGGLDPETNGTGGTNTPGFGNRLSVSANTPITRSFIFGINIRY
jgi:TonB-linked SusC/RagA family outer membrane protein